jgi:uncharacterized protein
MPVYLAPGVFVEEVPSAQQPIAAVGTNTVGFIGVVDDQIFYPVANDNYDPQAAMEALLPPDQRAQRNKERIDEIAIEIKALDASRDSAGKALEVAKEQLAKAGISDADKKKFEKEVKELNDEIKGLQTEKAAKTKEQESLTKAPKPDATVLKPYILSGPFDVTAKAGDAKLCTNFSEYTEHFGPFSADDPDKDPGVPRHRGHRALTHAVYGFFRNGGTRCFVARVRSDNPNEIDRALTEFESIDEIAIVAAPGLVTKDVWNKLVAHCDLMGDRFAILDSEEVVGTDLSTGVKLLNYTTQQHLLPATSKNAAFYFPWIEVIDPAKQLQDQDPARGIATKHRGKVYVPPSGHVAGIYARVDEQRGVHKAPGNEAVVGALDVKYYVGKNKQELLNPQGVNCIRNLNGNIRVYGARTIGGDKNGEWKYINVRRVFLFLKESIDEGTQWVVFEPNDPALWGKIKRNVTAFLTTVWRDGALFGTTPQEAFYVKCDEETNPPEVRDLGRVITEIGVAIVRPAEFVIFRVAQWAGPKGTTA